MPQPETVLNSVLHIEDAKKWGYNLPDELLVKQVVPELIFKKTRYLFYNTSKRESFIVPRNLRDLRQLLLLLLLMPDYSDEKEINVHIENKVSFKKYLFEDWVAKNLTESQRALATEIIAVESIEELNYTAIKILTKITDRFKGTLSDNSSIGEVIDSLNNALNISLGDVVAILKILEDAEPEDSMRKFLFFIRALYGIRLYEAYDTITMKREYDREKPSRYVIKKGLHRLVRNDYEAIVGGSLCNEEIYDYLPKVSNSVHSSIRNISRDSLLALANKCVESWDSEDGQKLVKLMELMMLSVYYDDANSATTQNGFRRSDTLCYRVINPGCKDLKFDLGALMFNIGRPKDAINRFRSFKELKPFFGKYVRYTAEKGLLCDLYNKMKDDACRVKDYKTLDEKWLSYCCFRNMEILEDFLSYIRGRVDGKLNRKDTYDASKPIDSIIAFFELASEYVIYSYDRFDTEDVTKNNAYSIHFNFYKVILDFFMDETVKNEFETIFSSREKPQESLAINTSL